MKTYSVLSPLFRLYPKPIYKIDSQTEHGKDRCPSLFSIYPPHRNHRKTNFQVPSSEQIKIKH